MYLSEQPPFLNAAVLGHTDLSPLQLLYHLKQIEKAAGEARHVGSQVGFPFLDVSGACPRKQSRHTQLLQQHRIGTPVFNREHAWCCSRLQGAT
jgi:hypothetical protein